MNDNYAVINGKRVELTDEQVKALGIETRKNPFKRVAKSEKYCYIDAFDEVHWFSDNIEQCDDESFECSNYFNDEQFAKQVALHQLLYRKLLKFAYDNGFEDTAEWGEILKPTCDNTCESTAEWSRRNQHYSIRYSYEDRNFVVYCQYDYKGQDVYFSSEEAAKRAIKEIVEPFMKEHPDFVW